MLTQENLNETLADAVMDRPREFYIGDKRFCLWSPTLGMSMMIGRHLESFDVDYELIYKNPSVEAFRIVSSKRIQVCRLLSILSFRRFEELSNSRLLDERAKFFCDSLDDSELVRLLLYALSNPKAETIMSLSGIDKEQKLQSDIAKIKNKDGHSQSFGGKTIYGTLINTACKAYGWTKKYVVWGIDLISLKIMLADTINSIYLSEEELKSLNIKTESKDVYGMTPEDIAKLKAMDWD